MNVVLMHYHLNTGGVTTVIRQQIRLLQGVSRLLVISGQAPPAGFPAAVRVVPEIAYRSQHVDTGTVDIAVRKIRGHIHHFFSEECDIVHVHNPLLAKNRGFLDILKKMQSEGLRLFLQLHDFAEDGRPGVFFKEPYPENCHYGVINSRDYHFLVASGLDPAGLHLLPNMVTPLRTASSKAGDRRLVLYPVRAIRRKNLGEAILLSHYLPSGFTLGVTLPPNSENDLGSYRDWKKFVRKNSLPVRFGIGQRQPFPDLVNASAFFVTTSIREGFGFSFLEPWTAGKVVSGRHLSGVCDDFQESGISLSHLYRAIRVPLDWIFPKVFFRKWRQVYGDACRWYDVPVNASEMEAVTSRMQADASIDFGLLDERAQRLVLDRISQAPLDRRELQSRNDFLGNLGQLTHSEKVIASNRNAILHGYSSLKACRGNILGIYRKIMHHRVCHCIDKKQLARHFLSPRDFPLLQWGAYGG